MGIETAAAIHVEYPAGSLHGLLNDLFDGARGAAHDATRQLTGKPPKQDENPEQLTEEQFRVLVQRLLDLATTNTTTWDAVTATAKALGTQIAVLSRRPDTSIDQLIQELQKAVASFAYEGRAYLEAQPS